jgi:hypothetical protein
MTGFPCGLPMPKVYKNCPLSASAGNPRAFTKLRHAVARFRPIG